jgi:hypothetical protein
VKIISQTVVNVQKQSPAEEMVETEKERLLKQLAQLKNERTSFEPHWRDLSDFINPRGSRFLTSDVNRDDRRNTKIVDPTGSLAQRILASGMMSGITSPARPWFKLATPDPDMMDYGPVKVWLEVVQRRMNEVFNKSNLYQSLPVTIRTELAAVTVTYQVITKVFMLEACYHAFWVDHVSSVLTPRHKPDRGVGRTATTGTEYVFCACSFAGAQRIETRRQAHESFRLGIGVAVDGVAGDFVVEALQLAHVFGNTERCGIVGTVCQSLINEAQVVQHTGGVGHWYGLGFGWLNALVIAAPYRFRNTCADGGFVLRAVVTRHIDRIGQDVVGFRQLLHDARDSPVLVSTIVDVKQRWQSLTD